LNSIVVRTPEFPHLFLWRIWRVSKSQRSGCNAPTPKRAAARVVPERTDRRPSRGIACSKRPVLPRRARIIGLRGDRSGAQQDRRHRDRYKMSHFVLPFTAVRSGSIRARRPGNHRIRAIRLATPRPSQARPLTLGQTSGAEALAKPSGLPGSSPMRLLPKGSICYQIKTRAKYSGVNALQAWSDFFSAIDLSLIVQLSFSKMHA
jgi:hypothetical protein